MHIDNNTVRELQYFLVQIDSHLLSLNMGADLNKEDILHHSMFLQEGAKAMVRKLGECIKRAHKESCGGCGDCRENNGENCSDPK